MPQECAQARTDPGATMLIDSGFGTREVPTARMRVNVAGRERAVTVELRSYMKNREEDGLVLAGRRVVDSARIVVTER